MISEQLKLFRKEKGYTLVELEKLSGVSYVQIGRYEQNKSTPTSKTLNKLAKALEKNTADFLEDQKRIENISDEELDRKYNKIKSFFPEKSETRYALNTIFDLFIFKENIRKLVEKK